MELLVFGSLQPENLEIIQLIDIKNVLLCSFGITLDADKVASSLMPFLTKTGRRALRSWPTCRRKCLTGVDESGDETAGEDYSPCYQVTRKTLVTCSRSQEPLAGHLR